MRTEASIHGVPVSVTVDTDYPFRDHVRLSVRASAPVDFPLRLRIPAWADAAELRVEGGAVLPSGNGPVVHLGSLEEPLHPPAGTFCIVHRRWTGTTELSLSLPMRPRLRAGSRGAVAVERGPLVYALSIGEDWRRIHADKPNRELPHGDWEVYPTTPWNYALAVSRETLGSDVTFVERPVGEVPFSPAGAPVAARVRGRRVPGWGMAGGSAADVPEGPVASREPEEELTLLPYGCTNLRMTELPLLRR